MKGKQNPTEGVDYQQLQQAQKLWMQGLDEPFIAIIDSQRVGKEIFSRWQQRHLHREVDSSGPLRIWIAVKITPCNVWLKITTLGFYYAMSKGVDPQSRSSTRYEQRQSG